MRAQQPTLVFLPGESPWTEEPGALQSMGSQKVRHDWVTKHSTDGYIGSGRLGCVSWISTLNIYCVTLSFISIRPTFFLSSFVPSFFLFLSFLPSFPSQGRKNNIVLGVKCCFSHRLKIEVKNWSHYLDLSSVEIPKLAFWIHLQSQLWEKDSLMCWVHTKSFQSCLTLCNPTDCSPPDSSVHGILQASILKWVAVRSSRALSQPRDRTRVSYVFCVGRWVRYH